MKSPITFLLSTKLVAKHMRSPDKGILGKVAIKMMTKGNRLTSEDAASRLDIAEDHCVVELGAGSGWGLRAFAEGKPKRLVAVEISPRFREELARLKLPIEFEVYGDDAIDMSSFIESESVDRLLAVNVVYFLNPLANYARELYRVMRPNGRGILACKPNAIKDASDSFFVNKDIATVVEAFEAAGFKVTQEEVEFDLTMANYTAISIVK